MVGQTVTMTASRTTPIDDEALVQQVRRALEGIKPLRVLGSPLHVQVNDGIVTLHGVVATHLCKMEIVRTVCNVPGVREVHDELWV
jgi:osmotically-inducible protein OsmY